MAIELKQVVPEEVVDLRHRLLRAGLEREAAIFPGDELASTIHAGAFADGRLVCCLTLILSSWEERPAWQLRGMATEEGYQRSGVGRALVGYAIALARAAHPEIAVFWCNARVPAKGFYEKLGWRVVSEQFDIPTAGPHVKMVYRGPETPVSAA